MTEKTLVGVTGPDQGGTVAWWMTRLALKRAGAVAVRLTPSVNYDTSRLNAFIIGGGTDVEPVHYGQEPAPRSVKQSGFRLRDWLISILLFLFRVLAQQKRNDGYDPPRDRMEKALIEYALAQGLPLLGICRGAQLLNIVTGGSLYQRISEFYVEEPHVRSLLPRKKIVLTEGSRLADLIGDTSIYVNALHDQAIDRPGDGMIVTARDTAGVVQAIEHSEHEFVIGVQWHPEYLPQMTSQQVLFRDLVDTANKKKRNRDCVCHQRA
jgi:putative glutamine amidotransferase